MKIILVNLYLPTLVASCTLRSCSFCVGFPFRQWDKATAAHQLERGSGLRSKILLINPNPLTEDQKHTRITKIPTILWNSAWQTTGTHINKWRGLTITRKEDVSRNNQQQSGQTWQFIMYLFQVLLLKNYPLLDIQFVGKQPEKGQTKK